MLVCFAPFGNRLFVLDVGTMTSWSLLIPFDFEIQSIQLLNPELWVIHNRFGDRFYAFWYHNLFHLFQDLPPGLHPQRPSPRTCGSDHRSFFRF
jgi:hypothetical protein